MAETHELAILLIIFLGKFSLTHSKEANVTCIIQDDCILPCSFRPTGTVVIHWYKQQIPVHSYYYNKDQFGLQNKHFNGRTCLFNSQITNGNASLLLRRVKVQDKGRYKCYTSTRKGNHETFVNLDVKALIQSVNIEMTDEMVSCSSHNIYPVPQVAWATDPPSAREALQNSTIKTTDHKGLFTVESTLRILGNLSDYAYFCSFISADKTQVWTASRKNQENMTEEGHKLSIPCIAPQNLQNFSLTWTFTRSSEPTVILRYDSRTRHTFNFWEGQAELDQDLALLGDGSLLLHHPEIEEHTGTYTCTFSGLQSRHTIQTKVNVTVASISVVEQSMERSWWSTAASVAFVMFIMFVALPQCLRQGDTAIETRTASHRHNGAGLVEGGPDDLNTTASHISGPHTVEGNILQLQFQTQGELGADVPNIAESCSVGPPPVTDVEQAEERVGPPVLGNEGLRSYSLDDEEFGSIESRLNILGTYAQDLEAIRAPAPKGDSVGQQTVEVDDARTYHRHPHKEAHTDPAEGMLLNYIGQDLPSSDISESYTVETIINNQSVCLLDSQEEAS